MTTVYWTARVQGDLAAIHAFVEADSPHFSALAHELGHVLLDLLITRHGMYLHENVLTEELAHDRVYEFAFVFTPVRLQGATGSPGSPIAIR